MPSSPSISHASRDPPLARAASIRDFPARAVTAPLEAGSRQATSAGRFSRRGFLVARAVRSGPADKHGEHRLPSPAPRLAINRYSHSSPARRTDSGARGTVPARKSNTPPIPIATRTPASASGGRFRSIQIPVPVHRRPHASARPLSRILRQRPLIVFRRGRTARPPAGNSNSRVCHLESFGRSLGDTGTAAQ